MPIPGDTFEREMVFRREVPFGRTHQYDEQHKRSHRDVKPMEACQHEERRAIDPRVHC